MPQDQGQTRLFYMDNLRALAMLAGLFFHAALAYSPMLHSFWPSADPKNHFGFDLFAWASHLFRMPVFFLLAGFFCALMLHKSGGVAFFKNRMLRIALPLVLFLPLLMLSMHYVMQFGLAYVSQQPPLFEVISTMMATPEPPILLTTMHLWFLYHLLFLYLLTYCARILLGSSFTDWLLALRPNSLLLLMMIACIPALYWVSVPYPAPEWIFPALWALWFYGIFFALGYGFFMQKDLIPRYAPDRHFYFSVGAVSYAFYFYLLPAAQNQGVLKFIVVVFEAATAVLWTLSAVLYAKSYLNRSNPLLRYISDISYWVYIVHLPMLFFIQFLLTDLAWPIAVKFLISSLCTLAISMMSFHLLVSWTWLARMLVGKSRTHQRQLTPGS